MIDFLNYYYNILFSRVDEDNNFFFCYLESDLYLFEEYNGELSNLINIMDILNNYDCPYHLPLYNRDNSLITNYDDKEYVLMKVRCSINGTLDFNKTFFIKAQGESKWGSIWASRVDYYEKQFDELDIDKRIMYAMQYYIGLTENAIALFNNYYSSAECAIMHRQVSSPIKQIEYYDPLNLLIDISIRDFSEYFKSSFFNEILTDSDLLLLIDNLNISADMSIFLFIRLLYPSYFFNIYDDDFNDDRLFLIIKKSSDYESLLRKVYSRLNYKYNLNVNIWFLKFQH